VPSVLILTQYYPPETGAPQNRLSSLARHLKQLGADVAVLTAMPNYPAMQVHEDYKGKWFCKEELDGIPVYRSWIYARKATGIAVRLLNYFSFVFSSAVAGLFRMKKYDIIICESPPLFLGMSALLIKLFRRSKLVFNVSDLWPESAEKLNIVNNKMFLKAAYALEAWLYQRSALVSGQTQGIVKSIQSRFPKTKTFWLPNGIDSEKYNIEKADKIWRQVHGFNENDFIVLYAGILGHAQALEVILKAADRLRHEERIKFIIVGDGPQKDFLHHLKAELKLQHVFFFPNQPAANMPAIIYASNAAIIPLKNIPLFMGAIPSKIFENLAFSRPILLGVDGEARELFIEQGKCGLFFTPDDDTALANGTLQLSKDSQLCATLGANGKAYVYQHFNRANIAAAFYEELKAIS